MLLVRDVTAVVLAGRGGVVCALWDAKTAVCMALEVQPINVPLNPS
jgi:hypothetical protein